MYTILKHLRLIFALLTIVIVTKSAIAQDQKVVIPTLIKPAEAIARMNADQAIEAEAYTLGVQTVIWGMQWVKAAQTMRLGSSPLPQGTPRMPIDPMPHGINIWGHAQGLLKNDGGKPSAYVLLPHNWDSKIPDGLKTIRVHSRYLLISPHVAVYGSDDLANVHALQKDFKLISLEDWGKSNKECAPGQPMRLLHRTGTKTPAELLFFEELCETLKDITLLEDEISFARQVGGIGVTLADGFEFEKLDPATVAGLKRAVLDAQSIIEYKARTLSPNQPGGTWMVSYDMTSLDDWLFRAAVGWKNVWGDLPGEILFPVARMDEYGKPLNGEHMYRLHFPVGQLPPSPYWRISLYDIDGYFTANPIRRYGIGNMAEKLKSNPDGSLTLFIQHDSPGKENETNWLPAPNEEFFLMIRMYQPTEKMLQGGYILPPLQQVK